jgi:hypothetical protein
MFGRLPWLALERRMRALRFLVFFDIGDEVIGQSSPLHVCRYCWRQRARPSPYGSPLVLVFAQRYTFAEYVPSAPSGVQKAPGRMVGSAGVSLTGSSAGAWLVGD